MLNKNSIPISIISNIFNPVGPAAPGGLEIFNYYLTKELEKRGVDIELYASGDSTPMKSLRPLLEKSLGFSQTQEYLSVPWNYRRMTVQEFITYTKFIEAQKGDRLIHFSLVNFLPIFLAVKMKLPIIVTLHMPVTNLHYQGLKELLTKDELKQIHFVGISHNQVRNFPVYKIIHHGVNLDDFKFSLKSRNSFIWIGRLIKEKGCIDAILAAKKAKTDLEIGGAPHDKNERDYFEEIVKPEINQRIRYRGFISADQRTQFYAARASLFTPKWEEPFGLIMIESMACGTPVIAYNCGAAAEIIKDGQTGFLIKPNNISELARAMRRINELSEKDYNQMRRNCFEHTKNNFSFSKMVDRYQELYQTIWNHKEQNE